MSAREDYDRKTASLVGLRIEGVEYWDIHNFGDELREWDHGDWHRAEMGVGLQTSSGPVSVLWTDTFFPYGVEAFPEPMTSFLRFDEDGPESWSVTDNPRWQACAGQPVSAVETHWERLELGPSRFQDGTIAGPPGAVDLPNTFIGNHDVTRIASQVGPDAAALAVVELATVAGVPSVYAGDELGWTGEKTDGWGGDDAVRPPFPPVPDPDAWSDARARTFRLHQDLLGLRRRHPWLVRARTQTLELTNTRYVYETASDGGCLVVELDVTDTPRALVRSATGEVLLAV